MRKLALSIGVLAGCGAAFAFQIPEVSRLDALAVPDPSLTTDVVVLDVDALGKATSLRAGWDRFRAGKSASVRVVLDGRSGAPLLVEGPGIRWPVRPAEDALPALEGSLRAFLAEHRDLLLASDAELVLDLEATGRVGPDTFQVVFARKVAGVPVEGDRYVFTLGYGNLIAFGATRWTAVDVDPTPAIDGSLAAEILAAHAGVQTRDGARLLEPPSLRLVPLRAEGEGSVAYAGPVGEGYASALVWRVVLSIEGERGTWVGMVDAHSGQIRAFYDDDRYAQVKGGVPPEAPDGICPLGCQQPDYPMPFARVTINGSTTAANAMGLFTCQPAGATASVDLTSPTVRIADACGAVSETVVCDADLDLGANTGSNCSVEAGDSAGNTRASRACFYHVNRMKEHARTWLTANSWLNSVQTQVNTNVASTCNAGWGSGQLHMFRAGGNCNNTCEAVGVAQHEWGHGMDQNDGGGFDNPSEAYADISEFLADHSSCIGRGFFVSGRCSGYGDTCLTCSGIRDMDWDARAAHTPATPAGFLSQRCPSGSGPCGKEVHCEAYVAGETIWDLAVRDLPASGLDPATAWQVVDRLWYQSRQGSGGNMYTCTLPNASGCAVGSMFSRLRNADDDDGNLANGTPHAAAIFAAFNRHGIACGTAGDFSNQSTTSCATMGAPALTATPGTNQVHLSWTPVDGAASYRVLRNDIGCDRGFTRVATVAAPATTHFDTGLANDFGEYYRVQAVGNNPACEGAVSACAAVTPMILGPFAVAGDHSALSDACSTGGAGGDGVWDAGETVKLSLAISNPGTETLTGVTATITSAFPGIAILDGTAAFPDVPAGGTAQALAPHFTVRLPVGAACGAIVPFDVEIEGSGLTFSGAFDHPIGTPSTVSANVLNEGFDAGIPAGWTVVNSGAGTGPAETWTTANPGGRTFTPPLSHPVAIVDSDFAGASNSQDEHLITPALDLSAATSVTLQFDHYFRFRAGSNGERGDVDVRSSKTGGVWVNVLRLTASTPDPEHRTINISAQAAGGTSAQVRFRYYLGNNEWWWQVDNVRIDTVGPSCNMTVCPAGTGVRPVPDGAVGSPMLASRANPGGTALALTWDVSTCTSPDHQVLYGTLATLPSYALSGSVCGLGTTGSASWSGVPAGNLWFVVVGTDGNGTEGTWGAGVSGAPRHGAIASGLCGNAARDNGGSCP